VGKALHESKTSSRPYWQLASFGDHSGIAGSGIVVRFKNFYAPV